LFFPLTLFPSCACFIQRASCKDKAFSSRLTSPLFVIGSPLPEGTFFFFFEGPLCKFLFQFPAIRLSFPDGSSSLVSSPCPYPFRWKMAVSLRTRLKGIPRFLLYSLSSQLTNRRLPSPTGPARAAVLPDYTFSLSLFLIPPPVAFPHFRINQGDFFLLRTDMFEDRNLFLSPSSRQGPFSFFFNLMRLNTFQRHCTVYELRLPFPPSRTLFLQHNWFSAVHGSFFSRKISLSPQEQYYKPVTPRVNFIPPSLSPFPLWGLSFCCFLSNTLVHRAPGWLL